MLYLLLAPQNKVHKEVVIEEFFGGDNINKLVNRLYVTIHRVNRSLERYLKITYDKPLLYIDKGVVFLNQELVEGIDVQAYRKLLSVANQLWLNDQEAAIELMAKAVNMFSSEIVPELMYLDWLELYRRELQNIQEKALVRLASYYMDRGKETLCHETFLELLRIQPQREEYYAKYIKYLLGEGRQVEAQAQQIRIMIDL
ncbi:MAG: bacterial transcriptional activator domain-containing protein [Bacillota bacterium]|nr:bacterial transcriptional activator domain-containing protein [Bacillota bacterium]